MSGSEFIDTNVLIYADDGRNPQKRRRARVLIRDLMMNRRGVVSLQVLQEFFAAATRKVGLSSEHARRRVVVYSRFDVVTFAPADLLAAIDLHRIHRFSIWDSLIVRAALNARQGEGDSFDAIAYYRRLYQEMDRLGIDRKFSGRSVNEGFSGGEKKRCEILQMAMLEPKYCVLDETDSGLDIDALKIVAAGINHMRGDDRGILVITHYQRLLNYIIPDYVHVMMDGRIIKTGDKSLALEVEERGYDWIKEEMAAGV